MGGWRPEEEAIWQSIQSLAPDVVILDQEDTAALSRAADVVPRVKLVALSLRHNRIRVYKCRDISELGVEGVIEAITHRCGDTPGAS